MAWLLSAAKGLPGNSKQFSAPNFTENYDMEAKVRLRGKQLPVFILAPNAVPTRTAA